MTEGFAGLVDLASRRLGGSVVYANDELFAEKENLIKPGQPAFAEGDFGNKGKVYDGWETRRRREPGHDHAIVRLGCAGVVHGVVVDTAYFRGNYPPEISVEAACVAGYPTPGRTRRGRLAPARPAIAGRWPRGQQLPGDRPAALDPRQAVDLPGRRRGTAAGARRGRARSRVPDRDGRPGRAGERRPGRRLLRPVLLVAVEPDLALAWPR